MSDGKSGSRGDTCPHYAHISPGFGGNGLSLKGSNDSPVLENKPGESVKKGLSMGEYPGMGKMSDIEPPT